MTPESSIFSQYDTPLHPRGHITPEHQSQPRGRRVGILGGALVVLAGITAYASLAMGGEDTPEHTSGGGSGSRPSATASPHQVQAENLQPRPTPELPDIEASATPQDIHYAVRRAIAERYDRCDVSGFTNAGVVKTKRGPRVRLDMSITYEQDPASVRERKHGESRTLHWDNPTVVAVPLRQNGKLDTDEALSFPSSTDRLKQNSSVYLPVKAKKGTDYAIGILTNAVSPYDDGHMETVTMTYCNTIENQGGNDWRQSAYDETVPEITSIDVYRP
ncbi:MAG TPA: hypothetical protein VFT16_00230 [Candidatus Saccharimonadales bacterium]|nr:hypothetical protein [Candidatus Saccharimonadales bacterium]